LTTAAREYGQDGQHQLLADAIVIQKAGYVYIYLSNDNMALGGQQVRYILMTLKVEHVKSPVISSQDYLPLRFNI